MDEQSHSTSKSALRQLMKERVLSLSSEQKQAASHKACSLLLEAFPPESFAALLCYWPLNSEISPRCAIEAFLQHGKVVALPRVVEGTRHMDFLILDPYLPLEGQLERGVFGTMEVRCGTPFSLKDTPNGSSTLLLVPGLAFGKDGSRLGRGAGFYDRAIACLRGEASITHCKLVVCGFCFAFQLVPTMPKEAHDASVDTIVCEEGVLFCAKGGTLSLASSSV